MSAAFYVDSQGQRVAYPGRRPDDWLRAMDADRSLPIKGQFRGRQTFYSAPGVPESQGDLRATLGAVIP